jgi:hypothetical protein
MSVTPARDAAWEERLEELHLFAAANGGKAHVKRTDPERKKLGLWCNNQARRSSQPGRDQYQHKL